MILKCSFIHKPLYIDTKKKLNPLLKVENDEQQ